MCGSNVLGTKVVLFSALIGILLANTLDDGTQKIAGSAFMIIGLTLFTMTYGGTIIAPVQPIGVDKCYSSYGAVPYYPEACYQ